MSTRDSLTRFAWLSVAAAVATIVIKTVAWQLTGSVGLLSDAAESVVNLVAAFVALIALRVAARPPDDNHHFGHTKAEYFSAAIEGVMIFVAALFIIVAAVERLLNPRPLDNLGVGLAVSVGASLINLVVGMTLLRAGRTHRSITLTADGRHLLTDVWTSAGILVGVVLVWVTGWDRLDPIIAILVGINILVTGGRLLAESSFGLMDGAMKAEEIAEINAVLDDFTSADVTFHGVRTREAGHQRFVSLHVLVPGAWTVQQGHDLLEQVEARLKATLEHLDVDTHLEPIEDPRAYESMPADARSAAPPESSPPSGK